MHGTITARAATDRGARYAKQLASHLGRRISTSVDDAGVASFRLDDATAVLTPTPAALEMAFSGGSEDTLGRLVAVVASHFERFASKDGVVVEWDDAAVAAEYAERKTVMEAQRAERKAAEAGPGDG